MVTFKEGVVWSGMHSAMWYARGVVDQAHRDLFSRDAVITSARRMPTKGGSSLHPKGRAIDIRVRDMKQDQQRRYAQLLRDRLGPGFDVVIEGPAAENPAYLHRDPHIHVEYDPK